MTLEDFDYSHKEGLRVCCSACGERYCVGSKLLLSPKCSEIILNKLLEDKK